MIALVLAGLPIVALVVIGIIVNSRELGNE
jgi:predicted branched-subunit amino acid permease